MASRKKKDTVPGLSRTRTGRIRLRRKPNAPYARTAAADARAQRLRARIDKAITDGQKLRAQIEAKIERKIRKAEEAERKATAERKRLGLEVPEQTERAQFLH